MMVARLFAMPPMNAKFWQQGWPPSWSRVGAALDLR